MNIFLTDGNNRATLAITRSLAKLGHSIHIGETTQPSLASCSKYTQRSISYPDPTTLPEDFIEFLFHYIEQNSIDIVIPVADISTILIAENADKLPKSCLFPFGDKSTIQHAADKAYVTKLASSIEVPIPKTRFIETKSEIDSLDHNISYPLVIKPSRSRVWTGDDWLFTFVTYANNEDELNKILSDKHPLEFPVLLQERINGPGIGVFMCMHNNKPVAQFSHKRLREKPPSGGVSVLRESIPVDEKAAEYARKLLKAINWQGIAMVEFKIDSKTNTPMLMEINGRFWGSLQLSISSGVNFPALLVSTAQGKNITPILNYNHGIKLRWLWGDIDHLLILLFKSRKSLKLPRSHPGKLLSLLRFLKFWGKNLNYEIISRDDMRPWYYETRKRLSIFRNN